MSRPPKYTTADGMQTFIDTYFQDCSKNRDFLNEDLKPVGKDDKPRRQPETFSNDLHPTISGLAIVLGLTRLEIINYRVKEEFVDTLREAKGRLEAYCLQKEEFVDTVSKAR